MNYKVEAIHNTILNAILADRSEKGIRSQYPKYYVWNEDKLYLVGSVGVMNLPASNSEAKRFNEIVGQLLHAKGVSYHFQNIVNMAAIVSYTNGTSEGTWKAMETSVKIEAMLFKPHTNTN